MNTSFLRRPKQDTFKCDITSAHNIRQRIKETSTLSKMRQKKKNAVLLSEKLYFSHMEHYTNFSYNIKCFRRSLRLFTRGCARQNCLSVRLWSMAIFICLAVPAFGKIQPPRFPGLPSVDELAEEAGVSVSHSLVESRDGYLVMMHRLGNNSGPPILLQHGLLNAADIWLSRGNGQDLVWMLVREGFDVYLGNLRGNAFSRRHSWLRPSDVRYWDFSFHESGYYDLPAMIDKILEMRKVEQIFYLGHSLGTTVFFVMASTRPEYNAKIRAAVMLSPVAHAPDRSEFAVAFLRVAIANRRTIWRSLSSARWLEVMPRTGSIIRATYDLCDYRKPTQDFCLDILGMYVGEHRANIDRKKLAYQISFSPAGTSLKTIYHLSQLFLTSEFDYLDLGEEANLMMYNSSRAPSYPLERITAPVALYWSYNDNLVSERSVKRIKDRLPNAIDKPIPDPKFTHADVFIGLNANEVLYNDIIALLNQFR